MRRSRCMARGWISGVALTLGLVLSGCGGAATTRTLQTALAKSPTPRPAAAATATTAAVIRSSSGILEEAGCPPVGSTPTQSPYVAVGALNVSILGRVLEYPSEQMPSSVPNAPYQLPASAVTAYAPNPPVNPVLSNGYLLRICNQTSAVHALSGIGVTIVSFTPSSGPVNVWHICGDGPYNAATKQITPGCGGAFGAVNWLAATFSSDSTGATEIAKAHGSAGVDLPVNIDPNRSTAVLVAVNGLTSQGTYTLSFGVSADGGAPVTVAPSDGPFLIAPSAAVWTGTACQSPVMQTQIPASSQDAYYVCPPAA